MRMRIGPDVKLVIGGLCLGSIVLLAGFGGFLSPHVPGEQNLLMALEPPWNLAEGHLLGTDHLGRDILARMTSGARVSLAIAGAVVAISGVVGVLVGALSGYLGGVRDLVIQKIVETFWAFPPILLAIALLAFLGQSLGNVILAESSLSSLGLGVPPHVPTWGGMLAEGRSYISRAWWLAVFPGLGIFVTVLGLNLLGDWARDRFDPRPGINLS